MNFECLEMLLNLNEHCQVFFNMDFTVQRVSEDCKHAVGEACNRTHYLSPFIHLL